MLRGHRCAAPGRRARELTMNTTPTGEFPDVDATARRGAGRW
ncbi:MULTISPECIES: hypothetical protein [Saccharopolyspora]|uniref:Uncharacterized protein n=1 Tax=Saccharopolyspora cebuensis TaxID=418759 RepID=A0ABV4CGI7_9PSEU